MKHIEKRHENDKNEKERNECELTKKIELNNNINDEETL
jgi:hypothetical protein